MERISISNICFSEEGHLHLAEMTKKPFKGPKNPSAREMDIVRKLARLNSPSARGPAISALLSMYVDRNGEVDIAWVKELQMAHIESIELKCDSFIVSWAENTLQVRGMRTNYLGVNRMLKSLNEERTLTWHKEQDKLNKTFNSITIDVNTPIVDVLLEVVPLCVAAEKRISNWHSKASDQLYDKGLNALLDAGFSKDEINDILNGSYRINQMLARRK